MEFPTVDEETECFRRGLGNGDHSNRELERLTSSKNSRGEEAAGVVGGVVSSSHMGHCLQTLGCRGGWTNAAPLGIVE